VGPLIVGSNVNRWSEIELNALRRLYPDHETKEIAKLLQRTFFATERKARAIGLHKDSNWTAWRVEDNEQLRRLYPLLPLHEIAAAMGRTTTSVFRRSKRLELDAIAWQSVHGPLPDDHVLVVLNWNLPRTPENMIAVRKDERWSANAIRHKSPEHRELLVLKRQIEREAQKQKPK